MSSVQSVSAGQFEREVLQSEVPVLIDFYADWCGPCRMMSPVVEEIADAMAGKAKVVKVDTESEPQLASAFHISSIPAFYVLHHGQVVDGSIGMTPAERLKEMLERAADDTVDANE